MVNSLSAFKARLFEILLKVTYHHQTKVLNHHHLYLVSRKDKSINILKHTRFFVLAYLLVLDMQNCFAILNYDDHIAT